MKKLMLIAMISLSTILVGCGDPPSSENVHDKDNTWMPHGRCVRTKVVEIEDHKYIMMDGYHSGGIIHAESCGCKK
jgi:hypothetical protein